MKAIKGLSALKDQIDVTAGEQWEYIGIGYNANTGQFYVDSETVNNITLTPLALRQCKEVETETGSTYRYSIFTKKDEMKSGRVNQRVQLVCLLDGELHTFGARSWTARAALLNPLQGQYHDENYQPGMWIALQRHIKEVRKELQTNTAPFCWEVSFKSGEPFKNKKSGGNITPINWKGFDFVGPETAVSNQEIYKSEDLEGWVKDWQGMKPQEVESEFEDSEDDIAEAMGEDSIDEIPGFDL